MIRIILITSFYLISSFVFAGEPKLSTDFTVKTGIPYKVVDAKSKLYFSTGDGHTISVKTDGETAIIQRLNIASMKEVSRKEYKDLPKNTNVQDAIQIDDKLYYIFEAYNKSDKNFSVYAREINMTNGTFGPIKKLFTTLGDIVTNRADFGVNVGWGFGRGDKFTVYRSADDSKIMIQYRNKPKTRDDDVNHDVLGFWVFDQDLKKVWGDEIRMPYTEAVMNNLAYTVAKDGKVYMLAYKNKTKSFELFAINSEGKLSKHPIDIDGKMIFRKFDILENNAGNFVCVGIYSNGIDFKFSFGGGLSTSFNTNGFYYFKMDKQGKVLENHDYEFPIEFIGLYLNERMQEKAEEREKEGKAGIGDLNMVEFKVQNDGSILLVAERQWVRKEMYGMQSKMVWHYANMVVAKISKEGELLWMKKLPKNQAGTAGIGQMSMHYVEGEGAHYFLFVDNPKNADLSVDEVPEDHKDGKGGYLSAFKVDDATGEVTRHTILELEDINGIEAYQFNVTRIFEAEDKVFMLEIYTKGKEDTMVKMTLN